MQHKTSRSCRVAIIYTQPDEEPEILLILEKPSSVKQKDNTVFYPRKSWKMPGGKFEDDKDVDIFDCAIRETLEETNVCLEKDGLNVSAPFSHCRRSNRIGSDYHEITTFLYLVNKKPKAKPLGKVKRTMWFPLSKVPSKTKFYGVFLADSHRFYLLNLIDQKSSKNILLKNNISEEQIENLIKKLTP